MNVSIHLRKKTYEILKNYNKIHDNLQVTCKISDKNWRTFNRNYNKTCESLRNIEHHTHTMFKFWNKWHEKPNYTHQIL